MKNILLLMCAVSISASACAKPNNSAAANLMLSSSERSAEVFQAYLYKQTGKCSSPLETHHYLSSNAVKIAVTDEGKDILASIELFLRPDGTYMAYYQESVVYRYIENGYSIDSSRDQVLRGQWTMNDERLVFSDLGQALAIQYNGMPAMRLKMESNVLSQGFKDQALMLRIVASTFNPIAEIDPCSRK